MKLLVSNANKKRIPFSWQNDSVGLDVPLVYAQSYFYDRMTMLS